MSTALNSRRHRDRFVPSDRLYILLGLGFIIPLGLGWIPNLPVALLWALLILYDVLILGIATWDYRRATQWQLELSRHCEEKLSIGRDNPIHLTLTVTQHPPQVATAELLLCDGVPADLRATPDILAVVLVSQQSPQQSYELTYQVFPPRRGQFRWQAADLRLRSPWGLSWRQWQLAPETAVAVYPDLMSLRQLSIRLSLETTGNLHRRHRVGGTEFSELREYSLGEDVRLIDWKATARRQRPIVRLLEPEREQPLLILLDRGRLMTAQVAGLKRFDWALNAALSLTLAGLRRGDRVGIAVFDKTIHTWIAPQVGMAHLAPILEQLHALEPVAAESDYAGVTAQVLNQYTRRALVVMLTDIVDEIASQDLLVAMGRLSPRFLPFCVALRDPQVDAQAAPTAAHSATDSLPAPEAVQTLYTQAVALDLLQQRRLAFAKLQQQGTLVLDAPAPWVSEQLVERYLSVKARGRL